MQSHPWRSIVVVTLSIGAALGSLLAQPVPCSARTDSSSTGLDSAIVSAMREYFVPGAALAVVRNGRVERLAGYGCANIDRRVAVDPRRTVFHVASVSKPFVALAALQLVERGAVDLHADVNRYLRGVQVPAGWNRPVTLHDLLTHTAGFEESVVGYAARTPADVQPLGSFLAAKLPPRGWAPGDVTAYSNYGYALAGYLVESVSRVSFADYVRNEVLEPLGMRRSSFRQPPPPDLQRDAALSYRCSRTSCLPIRPDFRSAYPPGGLVTTAQDMSRFLLAELGDSIDNKRVVSDSILRMMHTRQFSLDSNLPGLTYGFAEDELMLARALSHAGGASGYSSFVFVVPERRVGVFLVTNGGSSAFGGVALRAIEASLDPRVLNIAPGRSAVVPGSAVDPTGAYRLTRYAHHGVENLPGLFNGQLHVRRLAGDTISIVGLGDADGRYFAVTPNRWWSVNGRNVVAVRAANGEVTHFFGPVSYFGTHFPAAYERLAWYDEPHFLNELLSYAVGIPLLALLAWPIVAGIVWLVRRRTRFVARLHEPLGVGRRYAVVAACAFTALAVWFGFGFIAATNHAAGQGGGEIVYGLPRVMQILAWAPITLAALTVVLIVAMVLGGTRRWWSIPGLVIYTLITLNAVLFVAILVRWGYFPLAAG